MDNVLHIFLGVAILAVCGFRVYLLFRTEKDWCPDCREEKTVAELKLFGWRCHDCRTALQDAKGTPDA